MTRKGTHAPIRFVRSLEQGVSQVFELGLHHASRLAELMQQYDSLPMDLADASLVVLAEHLGHGRIFSTDQRDFNAYRWKNTHPYSIAPLHHSITPKWDGATPLQRSIAPNRFLVDSRYNQ